MGVDRTGNTSDSGTENVEKPPAQDRVWRRPVDQPGSPGQPSRLASLAAAREAQIQRRDEKLRAEAEKETSKDGEPQAAAPGKDAEQKTDESSVETDDAVTSEERGGTERPEEIADEDAEDEPDDARDKDAPPEPEDEPKNSSGSDRWEELEDRGASGEAASRPTETGSTEPQDESAGRDELSSEGQKDAADAETTDAESAESGDAWREHVDDMRAKWADLEAERTPDRPPEKNDEGEDLQGEGTSEESGEDPGDEPGSWRGDDDQYLNYEENYAAGRAFERVRDQEVDVTDKIKIGETEVADAELVGLEYRIKGEDRFKEKVAETLAAELREDPTRAAESIPDALRYTYQLPADKYVQGYREITEKLEGDGYQMVFSRNSWDTPVYKGVNTRWKTSGGQLFEVQFHTPESFEAKQLTHAAYERRRSPGVGVLEAEKLDDFQREVSAGIPIPKNISDIVSFRREE
ncbi:hypothetical protein [Actinomadura sp. K4S16]|uniref:hypothetical protein n=1 Tax=Actinomadura sp. K4S16 TaxID=1316147 RepID=UPI0011EFB05B|nr:hypothetical protein [Actinomadura sp. K4S16]